MLNIKDPEAHRLAKEIAARTGETLTETVLSALRDKRARLSPSPTVEERLAAIREITRETSRLMRAGPKFTIEDLYDDETGLPK
jgi:antitoxin VapB